MPRVRAHILLALLWLCTVTSATNPTSSPAATKESDNTSPNQTSPEPITSNSKEFQTSNNTAEETLDTDISSSTEDGNDTSTDMDYDSDIIITSSTSSSTTSEDHKGTEPVTVPRSDKSSTTGAQVSNKKAVNRNASGGIFVLIVIIIIVISLGTLLFILWKKGRSYSFDLTQANHDYDAPLRPFELTEMYIQEDQPHEANPVANGCAGEATEPAASSEQKNVPEEDSFTSDISLTPPMKKVEFNLELDLTGGESEPPTQPTDQPTDLQQNENNNNVTNTGNNSLELFTEINLDEPQ